LLLAKTAKNTFEVIVVGGGPAGSTCTYQLGKKGIKTLFLEKQKYPKDKTCGDAISGKSVGMIKKIGLHKQISKLPHGKVNGVVFSSPKGEQVEIKFPGGGEGRRSEGYVVRREVYDNFLFSKAKKKASKTIQEFEVTSALIRKGKIIGVRGKNRKGKEEEFYAKIVVGADGATSVMAKETGVGTIDPKHQCIAARAYYDNIKGLTPNIEIHFVKSVLPGYFWVFPVEDGKANVGIGMITSDMQKQNKKLPQLMEHAIKEDSLFKERFKDAKRISEIKGWTLPLGSFRRKAHGDGYVLCGDAASLIDPFSGEGVGNAMTSGYLAAEHIQKALKAKNYSREFLKAYEEELWNTIGDELRTSYFLQKVGRIKPLLNFVIGKAAKKREVAEVISGTLANEEAKQGFKSPFFYLKLFLM
jgi:menaquinone-9 beta-reductase